MSRTRHAFTLLELIVVIALIVVLISLLIVAFGSVNRFASRTKSLSSLRQMSLALAQYASDHKQHIMPGFIDESTRDLYRITPDLPDGAGDTCGAGGAVCDGSSYVWRLISYLDNDWSLYFTDYRSTRVIELLQGELDNGVYGPASANANRPLGLSHIPSFGMNSIFLGGDAVHGGQAVVDRAPWNAADPDDILAATRMAQVLNPAKVIAFAPTRQWNEGLIPDLSGASSDYAGMTGELRFGYGELRPPYLIPVTDFSGNRTWTLPQWTVSLGGEVLPVDETQNRGGQVGVGLPISRWGARERQIPVGHVDGHASMEDLGELRTDMTRWSPFDTVRTALDPQDPDPAP